MILLDVCLRCANRRIISFLRSPLMLITSGSKKFYFGCLLSLLQTVGRMLWRRINNVHFQWIAIRGVAKRVMHAGRYRYSDAVVQRQVSSCAPATNHTFALTRLDAYELNRVVVCLARDCFAWRQRHQYHLKAVRRRVHYTTVSLVLQRLLLNIAIIDHADTSLNTATCSTHFFLATPAQTVFGRHLHGTQINLLRKT